MVLGALPRLGICQQAGIFFASNFKIRHAVCDIKSLSISIAVDVSRSRVKQWMFLRRRMIGCVSVPVR